MLIGSPSLRLADQHRTARAPTQVRALEFSQPNAGAIASDLRARGRSVQARQPRDAVEIARAVETVIDR